MVAVYRESDKALVASYSYDSWGNILAKSSDLADINPFRYRTYYFDTETWFYYLQSRFYDPAIGRFINADSLVSTGQDALGYNMFAYCNNSPVLYCDSTGTSLNLAAAIGGATAGALINLTSYLVGCAISGTDVTAGGIAQALVAGMISGVFGAAAGSVVDIASKVLYSGYAAFVAAMYAETSGGNWLIALGATFSGVFAGSWIDTSVLDPIAEGFANYTVALFTGAPAELISSGIQNIYNDSITPNTTATPALTSTITLSGSANIGRTGSSGAPCAILYQCFV